MRVGLGIPRVVENTQPTDSTIRTIPMIRSRGGFSIRNRVQGGTIADMDQNSTFEYVCISVSAGAVYSVTPENPNTQTALEAGRRGTLVDAINKMAESSYRLLDGTALVTDCALSGASVTVFMYREK